MKNGLWIIVAALMVSVAANVCLLMSEPKAKMEVERDTVWKDSIIREPVAAETIQTGRVVYLKVAVPGERDTLRDTLRDSIEVPVPIVQKRYDDSLYTAWVSGFEPNLDSIRLHQPEVVTTITQTIVKRLSRWSVGPAVGVGVSADGERRLGVFVGVGVSYRW